MKNSKIHWPSIQLFNLSMPQYIHRIITAWVLASLFFFIPSAASFTTHTFYDGMSFPLFTGVAAGLFLLLCAVKCDKWITLLLILSAELYFVCAAASYGDWLFSCGLCLILCGIVLYSDLKNTAVRLPDAALRILVILLIVLFTLFTGIIGCLYYKNYWTPCYDFGIFSQMFYYMKETGECLTTCERDGLLNHFAVHFSPIFYLLLPLYCLIPSPCTLLIAQGFIVASGVWPLVLICKKFGLSNISTAFFSVCYILYPAFSGGCFFYLHENCFLAPLILWFLYFSEKNQTLRAVVFALLIMLVKEDAAVYTAVIALYFVFANKNRTRNLLLLCFSVLYFIIVTHLMSVYGNGIMSGRYDNYIYDGGGLFTVIKSVLINPVYTISQIFQQDKLIFMLQMLVPLAFLPLMSKSPAKLILLIPFVLVNLMTNYQYQYNIGYQYIFGSGAILMYLAASNFAELGQSRKKILICAVLSSAILFSGGYLGKASYIQRYQNDTEQRETIRQALSLIPNEASVAASTFLLPNLSQRKEIYELETTKQQAEYYVLDLRYATDEHTADDYLNEAYITVFYEEDIVGVFKRRTS